MGLRSFLVGLFWSILEIFIPVHSPRVLITGSSHWPGGLVLLFPISNILKLPDRYETEQDSHFENAI